MMRDKPVIIYPGFEKAPDQLSLNRFRLMRRGGYPASSAEDIRRHIITGQWKKKNPAREKIAGFCCDNFGNATGKVVQVVQNFIGPEGDSFSRRS